MARKKNPVDKWQRAISEARERVAREKASARGKPFEKGNKASKGKKKGIASYDAEELAARKIDNSIINRYLTINSHLTEEQLLARLDDPKITIFEKRIVKSLLGWDSALSFESIVERLGGKVPEEHVHRVKRTAYDDMSVSELEEEKRKLSEVNRKTLTYIEQERGLRPVEQQDATTMVARDVTETDKTGQGEGSPTT